jgi:hypothetical protein
MNKKRVKVIVIFTILFSFGAFFIGEIDKDYKIGKKFALQFKLCEKEKSPHMRKAIPEFIEIIHDKIDLHYGDNLDRYIIKLGATNQIEECLHY